MASVFSGVCNTCPFRRRPSRVGFPAVLIDMEHSLHERDRVGVQDAVMLENHTDERAFVENLRKRFKENLPYTYIGQVLVSVNPFQDLPIYTPQVIEEYQKTHFFDAPPHIFAVADTAYRSLCKENREQCVLISGESGAGKTEASKKVLQYIAAATGKGRTVEAVKDKLLQSNPVLEAFGNARTNRNNNSSRFGKYMDIAFNYRGDPVGGNILSYLLEKSRVVHHNPGERNFHIFHQLLAGADDQVLAKLKLSRDPAQYHYLTNGHQVNRADLEVSTDRADFQAMCRAMSTMELQQEDQDAILAIVASVLHLGNITFAEVDGVAAVEKPKEVAIIAELLGCDARRLSEALVSRTIDAHGDKVTSPLSRDMAVYARDALAKAVYDRLFTWLVRRLNFSLQPPREERNDVVMGILDIYGFEVFQKNSFEQFCINFCNEKLQQVFVELTLKSEQDEYLREGIEWEAVTYFDNKVIIDLIEQRHRGLIALLDEECLRPGEPTDLSLLAKFNEHLDGHPHYVCHRTADKQTQKTMQREEFKLVHYAGDVTYRIDGFLEKNNDLLFRDLRETMTFSTNSVTQTTFPESELRTKKRPETAVTQFKNSLNRLMEILMCKEPSYIRCIKPNDFQAAGIFTEEVVIHQVKYLGLMENLRVRRAGFAYRRPYEAFLERYKSLCPATWPNYRGPAKDGVGTLVKHLGYQPDDFRMGNTKLFIRWPRTLFSTEDAFQQHKHHIAAIIQKVWKGRRQRQIFLRMRAAAIQMQALARGFLARRRADRRRQAAVTVRKFIEGFITRNGPPTDLNRRFIMLSKCEYLTRLSRSLPKSVLDKSWPPAPPHCTETSQILRRLHTSWQARKYCLGLSAQRKRQLQLKQHAEELFKGKKKSYPQSVGPLFVEDRLSEEQRALLPSFRNSTSEKIRYCCPVTKFDRHGYKPRERALVVTDDALYLLEGRTFKLKHRLAFESLNEVAITAEGDSFLLLRIPTDLKKDKGDLILQVPHLIEAVTLIVDSARKPQMLNIVEGGTISHTYSGGSGVIDITRGASPAITKGKQGHLIVVG
ncbi:unconventional myosin IC isoform X2 [Thrips palmi]|uniref:Unconventional myosin IC isoform X2 n=1 Tax=Thrips palmi TaxID=161013 RepID=A0A6P8YIN2_THRPL|nr:unconventional myosin IC isoform X2 [Thrips palmi]